jgi:hypothetical protein
LGRDRTAADVLKAVGEWQAKQLKAAAKEKRF